MRIYDNFTEAISEMTRDLAEMGEREGIEKLLTNYLYSVMRPDYTEIAGTHDEWVGQEWEDRIVGKLNPGKAWKKWLELWEPRLEPDLGEGGDKLKKYRRRFSYTNSERMGGLYIQTLIADLKRAPESWELFLPAWHPIDSTRRGDRRVPDDIGYWFRKQGETLELTYLSRESSLFGEFPDTVALAVMLLWYVAQKTDLQVGYFHHFIGVLYADEKDLRDVF